MGETTELISGKFTLSAAEVTDLAEFVGLQVTCPEDIEPSTEVDVYLCPPEGVRNEGEPGDPCTVSHYRFIAVMPEYPEEGCVGLGDEIEAPALQHGAPSVPEPAASEEGLPIPNAMIEAASRHVCAVLGIKADQICVQGGTERQWQRLSGTVHAALHYYATVRRNEARRLTTTGQADVERLDWLAANEYDLSTRREDMGEDEYAILWFVVDSRKSTKRHLHTVSGHPLGSPREAIDAAMKAAPFGLQQEGASPR